MANRRPPGKDDDSLTIGGFLDSIIARQRLRERHRGPDHLVNKSRVKAWIDSLPLTEPLGAKDATFQLLLEQDSLRMPFTDERIEALLVLDRDIHPHLLRLESDYLAAKPGGELESVLWRACSELGRALIVTYERAFTDQLERLGSRAALVTLALILSRIVHYLAWQARLAAYRHADWIPGRWQQLHRMYRKARAFSVATQEVPDLSDPSKQKKSTVEAEYLALLLMWRLNSGTLSRTELAQAYYWLRDRPRQMVFVGTHRPGARLGLDPTQAEGLKPLALLQGAPEILLFDSSVLAEPLNATLRRLEERRKLPASEAETRRLRQQTELVSYLVAHWAVSGYTERAPRQPVDRRVELAGGWQDIAARLLVLHNLPHGQTAGRIDHRLPNVPPPKPASATTHVKPGRTQEERGGGLWTVRNESASGGRVVSPAGKGTALRVGDAVALHDPLTDQWDIALVRRWKLAGEDRMELGMMWLGRNAQPLVLYPGRDTVPARGRIDALGGALVGAEAELLMALVPAWACAKPDASFERAVPGGKAILRLESVELAGIDWCWAKLRVAGIEPGVAGERQATPEDESITEIEITAPRD